LSSAAQRIVGGGSPVEMDSSRWRTKFRREGAHLSRADENEVCKQVRTPTLKSVKERGGFCAKKMVTQGHTYICE